ncbi:MAG TPA: hypothetical protein VIL24_05100 [Clostridia bacterium]
MFKTFPYFCLIALVPSIVFGLFGAPLSNILFFYDNFNVPIDAMPYGFLKVLSDMFGYYDNGWYLVTKFGLSLIIISLIIGLMERHLRSGRFGFKNPIRRINESLLAILPLLILVMVIQILFSLIASGLVVLGHYVFSEFGRNPTLLSWSITIVIILGLQLSIIDIYSLCLLVPPVYIITGYPYASSISYAVQLRHKDSFKIFFACVWPYFVVFVLGLIGRLVKVLIIPFNIISYLYLILYFCSLSMTAYYELTGAERMDYRRKLGAGV